MLLVSVCQIFKVAETENPKFKFFFLILLFIIKLHNVPCSKALNLLVNIILNP